MANAILGGVELIEGQRVPGHTPFFDERYQYDRWRLAPGTTKIKVGPESIVYNYGPAATVRVEGLGGHDLPLGAVLQRADAQGTTLEITTQEPAEILVAGTKHTDGPRAVSVTLAADLKKVAKPWGYELWLTGEHPRFCLKHIFIKAGFKTSLQYHRIKSETICLMDGSARLHYLANAKASIDTPATGDLATRDLTPGTVLNITPFHLHRMEALSDIHLCEASTPQLDDVVRVIDDTKRPDGRLSLEHGDAPLVCILAAGRGSRMGPLGAKLNKALFPVGKKAAISRIIEKFPTGSRFVVALGYRGDQVRDYLAVAHPDLPVRFVDVTPWEGAGSGPGRSLAACREALAKPFYYVSCDTLWDGDTHLAASNGESWLGVAAVPEDESPAYCNVKVDTDGRVSGIVDKQRAPNTLAYVGMAYIHDPARYFEALAKAPEVAGEPQFAGGLPGLMSDRKLRTRTIEWTDLGDAAKYRKAAERYEAYDFSKQDEAFYVVNGRVVKWFENAKSAAQRVTRAQAKPGVFPKILDHRGGFYAYAFAPGEVLYRNVTVGRFRQMLEWLDRELWTPVAVEPARFTSLCDDFYRKKTLSRLDLYAKRYPGSLETMSVINGIERPSLASMIERVPWAQLKAGTPVFFHGDLHFDNSLFDTATSRFTLLDWRQDFAGATDVGDLYYDLGKMRGGIFLNYEYVKANLMRFEDSADGRRADFDVASTHAAEAYARTFDAFLAEKGLDVRKVRLITALIYLNMAPLHHAPFDKLLFALGRECLAKELSNA